MIVTVVVIDVIVVTTILASYRYSCHSYCYRCYIIVTVFVIIIVTTMFS